MLSLWALRSHYRWPMEALEGALLRSCYRRHPFFFGAVAYHERAPGHENGVGLLVLALRLLQLLSFKLVALALPGWSQEPSCGPSTARWASQKQVDGTVAKFNT